MKNLFAFLCSFFLLSSFLFGQKVTISGFAYEFGTGEPMPFTTVLIDSIPVATTTQNGSFNFQTDRGIHTLSATFVGYQIFTDRYHFQNDTSITIQLTPSVEKLNEFVVVEQIDFAKEIVQNNQMSTISLSPREMSMLPTIAGETDVIKVAQLLPGVTKGFEGTNDYFVRGGDADQNLVLLDGATVYNTGHLFGFLSVFNPDILGDVQLTSGGFTADQGGRLSSILDIKTLSGQADSMEVAGSIGIIASRIAYRQPIKKDKLTISLGGRRTYIDQILRTINAEVQVPYFFYDVNGRVDYQHNDQHSLYFSTYYGADVLDFSRLDDSQRGNSDFNSNFDLTNSMQTVGWNFVPNNRQSLTTTFSRTQYDYSLNSSFEGNSIDLFGAIEDYALRTKWTQRLKNNQKITAGYDGILHSISPSKFTTTGTINDFIPSSQSRGLEAQEHAVYVQYDRPISSLLQLKIGYRQSMGIADGKTYWNPEPRLALRYTLTENSSVKFSYSRMSQYLHRVSSSAVSLPTDIWYSITKNIKPQTADQVALGYTRSIPTIKSYVSFEGYYKHMNNLTEYQEGTNLLLTASFEDQLLQGSGYSYGLESLFRHESNRFKGWASYTLSWTNRQFDQLNNGKEFAAKYDRRHSVSLVGQYDLTDRWTFSAIWEFLSGSRFTPIVGNYAILNPSGTGVELVPIYTDRNAVSVSNSHRLDLGLIFKSKPSARFKSEWHFSVYNVYNRATPSSIVVRTNPETGNLEYVQPALFGLIPSVAYHFRF